MTLLVFPDINVWIALTLDRHRHHQKVISWYEGVDPSTTFVFCRHTQLGLLRLLSTEAVMSEDVMTQRRCWEIYDRWIESGQAIFLDEPKSIEREFRFRTSQSFVAPKLWADAYLTAFAQAAQLVIVTLDKALAERTDASILLGS